jgi:hypothetical protein
MKQATALLVRSVLIYTLGHARKAKSVGGLVSNAISRAFAVRFFLLLPSMFFVLYDAPSAITHVPIITFTCIACSVRCWRVVRTQIQGLQTLLHRQGRFYMALG